MASGADFDRLARAHMAGQVREAATIQVALAAYWDRIVDPDDYVRTLALFNEVALPLLEAGRLRGEVGARAYYEALMALSDLPAAASLEHLELRAEQARASLSAGARSNVTARALEEPGAVRSALVAASKAGMLRSAKRVVLASSREGLLALAARDPNITHVARVSDGAPCAFCAMLVSRGPVYTAETAGFRAHDGCGCSVRPVTKADPSGGWTADSRALSEAWGKAPDLVAFRKLLYERRKAEGLALAA